MDRMQEQVQERGRRSNDSVVALGGLGEYHIYEGPYIQFDGSYGCLEEPTLVQVKCRTHGSYEVWVHESEDRLFVGPVFIGGQDFRESSCDLEVTTLREAFVAMTETLVLAAEERAWGRVQK